ncbi:hypothetical protein M0Q97_06335 [Candidatus Dojkabacteria bacterium]|jgi:hypothetical protein|nr:hypothetical protein [Candidatus Dojkabacteria bacterium]
MKERKQKIYLSLALGIALFFSITAILLISPFNSSTVKSFDIEQVEVANITIQQADIFWKGYSDSNAFKLLYKKADSTGLYKEIFPKDVYSDSSYPKGYMYHIILDDLDPRSKYVFEIWNGEMKLVEDTFTTKVIKEEIDVPEPISGGSFSFDWIKITNNIDTYIIPTDSSGSWALDRNLIGDDYQVDIYASTFIKESTPLSSLFIKSLYARELANCDEINYPGVPSTIRDKASTFENALKLNGGPGGNPQYVRCYQDAYCEAEKVGVNGQWTLANWAHESNASDYEYPAASLYADFGVECCGVPKKNFQAQLGFFLSLSHDPCNCGSNCSKEQYYCCWANNYRDGVRSKECATDSIKSYLNGVMAYYYWTSRSFDPVTFDARLAGLPTRLKGSGKNVNCGPTDPIKVYEGVAPGPGPNPGPSPEPDPGPTPVPQRGICCALKISGKDEFRGDWENTTNKTCSQIWKIGREVYGGKIEYSKELPNLNRASCEKWWDGVCCNDTAENEWTPERVCKKKNAEYTTYEKCLKGEIPDVKVCCKDEQEYEWKFKEKCKNVVEKYDKEYTCLKANGEQVDINLKLEKGYNFIAWNASDLTAPLLASSLLDNPAVLLVATFKDGQWNKIMYREQGEVKGADFELTRGNAYLITTTTDFDLRYSGKRFTEFAWDTMKGWQYVPAKALDPFNNTKSVVLTFDEVDITQVGLWDKSLGKFSYYIYDVTGEEFGDSVRLNDSQGVFVKID